jgi:imidazolonepropionase-like amidohydrolase
MTDKSEKRKLGLKNVRVFDGQRIGEPSTVVIDGGIIGNADDIEGAEMIDGQGCVLLPGLIDAHVHLTHNGEQSLKQMASHGITTALDMGNTPEAYAPLRGRAGLPDVRSALMAATSPDSHHAMIFEQLGFFKSELVSNPADAKKFVDNRVAEGADYIKIIADVPGPDQPSLNALVAAAHAKGKLAIAHAAGYTPCQMAQEAGVDVLTHAPVDKALEKADLDRMLADERIIVPTPVLLKIAVKVMGRPGMDYSFARQTVGDIYRAGIPVLAGTDAIAVPGMPMNVAHGESLHTELELLVDAGLSTVDALRAATSLPAKHFGLHDRGVIEPGYRADLLLVGGDPIADIRATRSIKRVWCGGLEYAPVVSSVQITS